MVILLLFFLADFDVDVLLAVQVLAGTGRH